MVSKYTLEIRKTLQQTVLRGSWISTCRRMKLDPYHFVQNQFTVDQRPKPKGLELAEEISLRYRHRQRSPKAQQIFLRIGQRDYTELKINCRAKETMHGVKWW